MFNAKGEKADDQAAGKKGRTGWQFRFAFLEARELLRYFSQSLSTVTAIIYLGYILYHYFKFNYSLNGTLVTLSL